MTYAALVSRALAMNERGRRSNGSIGSLKTKFEPGAPREKIRGGARVAPQSRLIPNRRFK